MISTGYHDGTLKWVHNPIYEATTIGQAGILSEGAEQQADDEDDDGGPTYETIKLSLSHRHKKAHKEMEIQKKKRRYQ